MVARQVQVGMLWDLTIIVTREPDEERNRLSDIHKRRRTF